VRARPAALSVVIVLLLAGCSTSAPTCATLGDSRLSPDMLLRRVTLDDAERAHLVDGVPFGALGAQWKELRAQMQPGDQLWLYRISGAGFEEGYAVVRDCRIVRRLPVLFGDVEMKNFE
jgi:hypothetical protein